MQYLLIAICVLSFVFSSDSFSLHQPTGLRRSSNHYCLKFDHKRHSDISMKMASISKAAAALIAAASFSAPAFAFGPADVAITVKSYKQGRDDLSILFFIILS